jgi:formylmethanofuran:tetrahydromethanopterin formyltransferase
LVEVAGIEHNLIEIQGITESKSSETETPEYTVIAPQAAVSACPRLARLVRVWGKLPEDVKVVIERISNSIGS